MSKEQLHARDKIVQQMSRDSLIEENITKDIVKSISARQADFMVDENHQPQQAHDRNQSRVYYQASETMPPNTGETDSPMPTVSNSLSQTSEAIENMAITTDAEEIFPELIDEVPMEFAAFSERIADISKPEPKESLYEDIGKNIELLMDIKKQRLKKEIKQLKKAESALQYKEEEEEEEKHGEEAADESDEPESKSEERTEEKSQQRLKGDKKKHLTFKDDGAGSKGNIQSIPKSKKRLQFDVGKSEKEEEDNDVESFSDKEDEREGDDGDEDKEEENEGRLHFDKDEGYIRSGGKGKITSIVSKKLIHELEKEQEEKLDFGARSAYQLSRRTLRGTRYLHYKSELRSLQRGREEYSRRLKERGSQKEFAEKEKEHKAEGKDRLQQKSATSSKLKSGSRYQKEIEKEQSLKRTYQKKINQQKFIENEQRIHKNSEFVKKVKVAVEKAAAAAKSGIAVFLGIFVLIFVLLFIVFFIAIQFFQQGVTGTAAIYSGVYQSTYTDISECEAYFREMETDLEERILHIKEEYPGCDEYIYDLGNVGHRAVELISFIATKYQDFTLEMCREELESLFEEMYKLTVDITMEPRERDMRDEEGNILYDEEGNPLKEPYMAEICYITLTVKSWEEIMNGRLTAEERSRYNVYVLSQGAQQVYGNPLVENWQDKISSRFGYRIHPITKEKSFHAGIDIAVPVGTPLYSCTDGTVMIAQYSESAGYYIRILTDSGYSVIYMHLDSLGVSAGETVHKGMLIGATGNTGRSTGPHLHLEVRTPDNTPIDPTFIVVSGVASEESEGE